MEDAEIKKLVTDSIAGALKPINDALAPLGDVIKNQKVLADTMAADAKAKADAAAAAAEEAKKNPTTTTTAAPPAAPLTAEAVAKLAADAVTAAMDARDKAAKSSTERDAFIADKLKGIPAIYAAKLGSDPAKWAAEEQAIRETFKADLAKVPGVTVKDVGGGEPGGSTSTTQTADQKITAFKATGLSDGEAELAANMELPK